MHAHGLPLIRYMYLFKFKFHFDTFGSLHEHHQKILKTVTEKKR